MPYNQGPRILRAIGPSVQLRNHNQPCDIDVGKVFGGYPSTFCLTVLTQEWRVTNDAVYGSFHACCSRVTSHSATMRQLMLTWQLEWIAKVIMNEFWKDSKSFIKLQQIDLGLLLLAGSLLMINDYHYAKVFCIRTSWQHIQVNFSIGQTHQALK